MEGGEGGREGRGEVEAGEVSVCVLVQVKWPLFTIRAHLPILSLFAMTTVLHYFVNTHTLSLSLTGGSSPGFAKRTGEYKGDGD